MDYSYSLNEHSLSVRVMTSVGTMSISLLPGMGLPTPLPQLDGI